MRYFSSILIFCFSLFTVLPVNELLACGNHDAAEKAVASEKMCCKEKSVEEPAHCAEEETQTCAQNHPGKTCSEQGGCCGKGCTCPCGALPVGHTGIMLAELLLVLPAFSDNTLRQAFYFAQHMPEEVYLPIWQPPQLSA